MKITKAAKRVDVTYFPMRSILYRAEYQCPVCKVVFYNGGPDRNVTRFKCKCGQELIVNQLEGQEVHSNER